MGRKIHEIAEATGHEVVGRVDPVANNVDASEITEDMASVADVAIEFSTADAVVDNARRYSQFGLSAAVGTTGWENDFKNVQSVISKGSSGYLYASNFSLGIQLFIRLAGQATTLFDSFQDYDLAIFERHHKRKIDSPSGTALSIAQMVIKSSSRKGKVVTERLDRQIGSNELHVSSIRGGEEPGTHTLLFDSLDDCVELTHRARSRAALAAGALQGAKWLSDKNRIGMYSIDDFIDGILK